MKIVTVYLKYIIKLLITNIKSVHSQSKWIINKMIRHFIN